MASFAKQYRIDPETALRRVTTCRTFTIYQLADLMSRRLVRAVRDYAARLVVLADLLGTFNEPELREDEARRVLEAIDEAIAEAKKDALVLVTLPAPNRFDSIARGWADTLLDLSEDMGRVRARLLKHPSKVQSTSEFLRPTDLLRPPRMEVVL